MEYAHAIVAVAVADAVLAAGRFKPSNSCLGSAAWKMVVEAPFQQSDT